MTAWSTRRSESSSGRSEEHTSELQSQSNLVCRLLLEKKKHLKGYALPRLHSFLREYRLISRIRRARAKQNFRLAQLSPYALSWDLEELANQHLPIPI